MRLGIDLDGVVADFNKGWIERYRDDFGVDLPPDAMTTWSGMVNLTHFADMDAFWEWASDFGNGSLFRHLDTYPDALPALDRLAKQHEIVIITTKPGWAVHDTYSWLADRQIPTREVHVFDFDSPKSAVHCDIYLEDAPHNLVDLVRNRPESTVARFVRPWNDIVEGAKDVNDWAGFEGLVDSCASRAG
jgi:5'(3')-deoxyribonucleotidase